MGKDHSLLGFPLFWLGAVFAIFHFLPSFLKSTVRPLLTSGDVLDFFMPLAVMPCLYLVYLRVKRLHPLDLPYRTQRIGAKLLLALGGIMFLEGHGMHLANKAVGRFVNETKEAGIASALYMFDEVISHYMMDSGLILIVLGLLFWSRKVPLSDPSRRCSVLSATGGILFGLTFFAHVVKGQTASLALPAAGLIALLTLLFLIRDRRLGLYNPVAIFIGTGLGLSVFLFALGGIFH